MDFISLLAFLLIIPRRPNHLFFYWQIFMPKKLDKILGIMLNAMNEYSFIFG